MKSEFNRTDGLFSLCGLNCGLCPMQIREKCSGCFTGSTCYQTCPIAPCSVKHGGVDYCFQCKEYPCKRYDGIDRHDSLISHRNQKRDMSKAQEIGIEAYLAEQREKKEILTRFLNDYDDGTKDVFFCLAAKMLEVEDLQDILSCMDSRSNSISIHDKAEQLERQLRDCAAGKHIPLELRPW